MTSMQLLNEDGLIIYRRYLYLCDKKLCGALLLLLFEEDAFAENAIADMERRDEQSWWYTYERLADRLYDLFTITAIHEALCLLIEKRYISAWWHSENENEKPLGHRAFTVTLHTAQINSESERYWATHRNCPDLDPEQQDPQEKLGTDLPPRGRERHTRPEHQYRKEAAKVEYQLARARDLELPATLTLEQWLDTLNHFQWKCAYCQGSYMLLEHFVPLTQGGGTVQENCVPACRSCNSKKGASHPSLVLAEYKMERAILQVQQYLAECGEEGNL